MSSQPTFQESVGDLYTALENLLDAMVWEKMVDVSKLKHTRLHVENVATAILWMSSDPRTHAAVKQLCTLHDITPHLERSL